jgi:hypothetical protein
MRGLQFTLLAQTAAPEAAMSTRQLRRRSQTGTLLQPRKRRLKFVSFDAYLTEQQGILRDLFGELQVICIVQEKACASSRK